MEKSFMFSGNRFPKWLRELIDNNSVLEDWEPVDMWEDSPEDHVLYCWQPDGTILRFYEGSRLGLAQCIYPGKPPIKYVKLME